MNTNDLLQQVNWPVSHIAHKGTLTHTKAVDSETGALGVVTTASVLAHADKIQLRVRTTSSDGKSLFPVMDAEWVLTDNGQWAQLEKFVLNEQAQALDENRAVSMFQDHINLLGVKPQFQPFGLRSGQPPAPTSFRFDI